MGERRGPVLRWRGGVPGGPARSLRPLQRVVCPMPKDLRMSKDGSGKVLKKGLVRMVGKDLSWSKGCSWMKVRGWRQRDQGGAARAGADRRWESGVH